MRLLFSTLFAIVMAASLQAVSVAWTVPNSDWNLWNWATNDSKKYDINVYVFFSAGDFSEDAAGAAAYVTAKGTTAVNANYAPASQFGTSKTTPLNIWANNLNPDNATGYYYMVVFENNNTSSESYAVAQTSKITVTQGVTNLGDGVYNTASGTTLDPSGMDYFDGMTWLEGSTWFAPTAPEPTVMALLALGVASLALRRKIS